MKKTAGYFMTGIGAILVLLMTLIILEQMIKNPSFDLFSASFLFLAPAILIGVGYEMLNSTGKKNNDTK